MPFGTGEYQRIDQRPANDQLTNDQQGSPLTYASTFHQRRKVQKKPSVSFNLETFVRNHIDNCSTSNSLSCSAFPRFPSQGCQYMVWQYIYIYYIYSIYIYIILYIYIVTQDNSSLREPKQPKMIQDVFSSKSTDGCHPQLPNCCTSQHAQTPRICRNLHEIPPSHYIHSNLTSVTKMCLLFQFLGYILSNTNPTFPNSLRKWRSYYLPRCQESQRALECR